MHEVGPDEAAAAGDDDIGGFKVLGQAAPLPIA